MIIRTKRLILRKFEKNDLDWYYDVVQNDEIKKWLKGLYSTDKEQIKSHIDMFVAGNDIDDFYYVITNKKKEILGFIIAVRITHHTIDVSYFLKEEYRHNGYMIEAIKELVSTIRSNRPMCRFRMEIDKDNVDSFKLIKKFNAQINEKECKYMCYI